jgi:hypothetical protein
MSTETILREYKTKNFAVQLRCDYEDFPDLSWADQETLDKLDSGEWTNYVFSVVVLWKEREIAADYLGNSIYEDPQEFYREHLGIAALRRKTGKNYGCYFSDMMRTAIAEARKTFSNAPKLRAK